MDPLWNNVVVAGLESDGSGFVGYVDKIGTAFKDRTVATGFGAHIALVGLESFLLAFIAVTSLYSRPDPCSLSCDPLSRRSRTSRLPRDRSSSGSA